MSLTDEQKKIVSNWVVAGDNLSVIQKKLSEELKISMTYMDVRFLVDDLNLLLKDAPPKASTDLGKPDSTEAAEPARSPGKKGFLDKAKEKLGLGKEAAEKDPGLEEDDALEAEADLPGPGSSPVKVSVDKVTLIPGAVASGTVSFSDGVTGKWVVDNYGRPGFTEISRPNYRPSAADAQFFMQELSAALQQRGL
jgi:hypothetical protein